VDDAQKNAKKIRFNARRRAKITREIRGIHLPLGRGGRTLNGGTNLKTRRFPNGSEFEGQSFWDMEVPNYRYF
jgi:hypothetical protein